MECRQVLSCKGTHNRAYLIGIFPVECGVLQQLPDLGQLASLVTGCLNREPQLDNLGILTEPFIKRSQGMRTLTFETGVHQSPQGAQAVRHVVGVARSEEHTSELQSRENLV